MNKKEREEYKADLKRTYANELAIAQGELDAAEKRLKNCNDYKQLPEYQELVVKKKKLEKLYGELGKVEDKLIEQVKMRYIDEEVNVRYSHPYYRKTTVYLSEKKTNIRDSVLRAIGQHYSMSMLRGSDIVEIVEAMMRLDFKADKFVSVRKKITEVQLGLNDVFTARNKMANLNDYNDLKTAVNHHRCVVNDLKLKLDNLDSEVKEMMNIDKAHQRDAVRRLATGFDGVRKIKESFEKLEEVHG
jgi:hypothetical protein